MTIKEFSYEFDVLYNNIMSNQAPGINDYEKSIFLTKAQEQLVRNYFEPQLNKSNKGFDASQKRQYDFSSIIKAETVEKPTLSILEYYGYTQFDSRSVIYALPSDCFLILNEVMEAENTRYSIIPITYSEYQRLMARPYQYPVKRKVWRLITDKKELHYNNVTFQGREFTVRAVRADVCKKPILIRIIESSNPIESPASLIPPTVIETDKDVTITLMPPVNYYVQYWLLYLSSATSQYKWKDSEGNDIDGFQYLKPFSSDEGEGLWPSVNMPTPLQGIIYSYGGDPNNIGYQESYENNNKTLEMSIPYSFNSIAECIGNYPEDAVYKIRYVRTLKPIILTDLSEYGTTINGYHEPKECELPVETHEEILQRAVELAKAAYTGDLNSQVALGISSGTDIGMITRS